MRFLKTTQTPGTTTENGSRSGFSQIFDSGSRSENNAKSCRSRLRHSESVATSGVHYIITCSRHLHIRDILSAHPVRGALRLYRVVSAVLVATRWSQPATNKLRKNCPKLSKFFLDVCSPRKSFNQPPKLMDGTRNMDL